MKTRTRAGLNHRHVVRKWRHAAADGFFALATLNSQHGLGFHGRIVLVKFAGFQIDDVLLARSLLPENGLHARRFDFLHGAFHIWLGVQVVRDFANHFQGIAGSAAYADGAAAALLTLLRQAEWCEEGIIDDDDDPLK